MCPACRECQCSADQERRGRRLERAAVLRYEHGRVSERDEGDTTEDRERPKQSARIAHSCAPLRPKLELSDKVMLLSQSYHQSLVAGAAARWEIRQRRRSFQFVDVVQDTSRDAYREDG